jgi:arabinan endo-1,5-alpha-L-arabinosidase
MLHRPHVSPPRSLRVGRTALVAVLAVALSGLAAGSAAAAPPGDRGTKPDRPVTGSYTNPLAPTVPGGGTVDSCADPVVLRGQQEGDPYWYMWCTTDPLNDDDRDAAGDLVFNKVPQLRSTDLVDWEYVGNAFDENPSWAPDAALWAPDVVYSEAFDRYYLFTTVTNTDASVSGVEDCDSDSAIGVAVSESPTGPWEFSDTPVVAPRPNGDPQECNFFWTYDPDVLGDAVGSESVLYYGSYYGGLFGPRSPSPPTAPRSTSRPRCR